MAPSILPVLPPDPWTRDARSSHPTAWSCAPVRSSSGTPCTRESRDPRSRDRGSFVPGIGGHNIFEPIQAGIPVLFGPHMEAQKELVQLILDANAGLQTTSENLSTSIQKALTLTKNAENLASYGKQPIETTWNTLQPYLLNP